MTATIVNPSATALRRSNGVMTGRGAPYFMPGYVGSLSVKYMIRGTGSWRTHEHRYQVDPRHFAVINEGEWYSFELGAGEPIETFCPFIEARFFADVTATLRQTPRARLDDPFESPQSARFEGRLRRAQGEVPAIVGRMYAAVKSGLHRAEDLDDLFRGLAEALVSLQTSADEAARCLCVVKPSTRRELDRRLHRARDHMHDRLADPLVLEDIATQASLSPHHFHRLFRQRFGVTPHRYLVERRLERAADLLRATDWPVAQVAASVGFDSRTSFTARFGRYYGVSPGAWRQQPRPPHSQE